MNTRRSGKKNVDVGLDGIFSGLTALVEKLNELAETGKELHELKEFTSGSGLKGVYGVNVRVGLGDRANQVVVEPFGNIGKDERSGHTVVRDVIEPLVDVFDEGDHTLVVAEMPGVSLADVDLDIRDDVLTIHAERSHRKYHKEVLLPHPYTREQMQLTCNNGILEIKCTG